MPRLAYESIDLFQICRGMWPRQQRPLGALDMGEVDGVDLKSSDWSSGPKHGRCGNHVPQTFLSPLPVQVLTPIPILKPSEVQCGTRAAKAAAQSLANRWAAVAAVPSNVDPALAVGIRCADWRDWRARVSQGPEWQ